MCGERAEVARIVVGEAEAWFGEASEDPRRGEHDGASQTARRQTGDDRVLRFSGVSLIRTLPRRTVANLGAILVGLFGIGQFIDGLAREDCPVSVNAACRAAEEAGRVSTHHKVHNAESLVTFTALMLAPFVLGLVLRSIPRWRRLTAWSFTAAAIQVVCLPVFLAMYSNGTSGQGAVEIIELTVGVAWIATISIAVIGTHRAQRRPPRRRSSSDLLRAR